MVPNFIHSRTDCLAFRQTQMYSFANDKQHHSSYIRLPEAFFYEGHINIPL